MTIIARPLPARWMRLLAVEADLPAALITLARHAPVEPEALAQESKPVLTPELASCLHRFDTLAQTWHLWWPTANPVPEANESPPGAPREILDQALAALEAWQLESEPMIRQEQRLRACEADWIRMAELARALGNAPLLLDGWSGAAADSLWLHRAVFVLPPGVDLTRLTQNDALICPVQGEENGFLLVAATADALAMLTEQVSSLEGRPVTLPDGVRGRGIAALPTIAARLQECRAAITRLDEALQDAGERHRVAHWIRAVHRLQWFFQAIRAVGAGDALAQLGGWVAPGIDASQLNGHLQRSGVRALATLSDSGPVPPPLLLVNPWWARPFEIFPRLLGMPNRNEVDPSRLLAVIAPLLFGYMFGDVGQGAVLLAIGYRLRHKRDASWLLITGGAAAIFFGLLFGSVFCSESILPALWLHPTSRPLAVLAAPLVLGVGLILGGLGFRALGSFWGGHGREWLRHDGGIVLIYLGVLLAFFFPAGYALAVAGVVAFVVGNGWEKPLALPGRLAHLVESLLQLGVNTFSFARVGAFALAHAGLSHAVITLAGLAGGGVAGTVVLVLGNLLILSLEGLVVSVQTTRLILFEFFVRFLSGDGRPFRPLPPPE
ncbi:MAG: hypothetical protein HQL91_00230 [Magnetococcales bacterium]|nr:hypothetical protein [Magnetococcales bacterium]